MGVIHKSSPSLAKAAISKGCEPLRCMDFRVSEGERKSSDDDPRNRPMSFGGYLGSEEAFDKILQGITYKDNTEYLFYKKSSGNTSGNPSDNRPRTLS